MSHILAASSRVRQCFHDVTSQIGQRFQYASKTLPRRSDLHLSIRRSSDRKRFEYVMSHILASSISRVRATRQPQLVVCGTQGVSRRVVLHALRFGSCSSNTLRVSFLTRAGALGFTDGIGTPDPNPKHLVNWCF